MRSKQEKWCSAAEPIGSDAPFGGAWCESTAAVRTAPQRRMSQIVYDWKAKPSGAKSLRDAGGGALDAFASARGKQSYRCKNCGCQYVENPQPKGYSLEVKQRVSVRVNHQKKGLYFGILAIARTNLFNQFGKLSNAGIAFSMSRGGIRLPVV